MVYRIQEPPNSIQCEASEGCNLYCDFCGLQGIREKMVKNYKFMAVETADSLFKQVAELGWNPRVEFANHGEPTLNPNLVDFIRIVRKYLPKVSIMVTTNGGGLLRGGNSATHIQGLFNAGLNILALDDYKGVGIVPKIREKLHELTGVEIFEYPANPLGNPHIRAKPNKRMVTIIEDISVAVKGVHSQLNNHAGAGSAPNQSAAGKKCAKPFRELSVRWDGNVAVCCNDWRGFYRVGNVVTDGLDKVWNGSAMGAARTKLYHGQRDFGPCNGCDAKSYRVGLLPDKFGKVSLPLPNEEVDRDLTEALSQGPYTTPVKRPWEQK